MKRFLFSLAFCAFLLIVGAFVLADRPFASGRAAPAPDDIISSLLRLPAPAPPNPLVPPRRNRGEKFFDRSNPPPDDAPLDDLLDYWRYQNNNFRGNAYNPKPTEVVLARIIPEIEGEVDTVLKYLNVVSHSPAGVEMVKRVYDSLDEDEEEEETEEIEEDGEDYSKKSRLRNWLTAHSPHFVADLEHSARQRGDVNGYVGNQDAFHSLTKADWDRARPMVDRMYADGTNPASQMMARWALYRNALTTGSTEADRFRDELKAAVENRELTYALRDLALDALLMEKEWAGRDDWYFTLMADESLVRLRPYTGLTTLMIHSPDNKYIDKMIELAKSENKAVRTAAARNLLVRLDTAGPEAIKALLPWLSDASWALDDTEGRDRVIGRLAEVKVPESMPALVSALDEKSTVDSRAYSGNFNTNTAVNAIDAAAQAIERAAIAVNAAANAANAVANAANVAKGPQETYYPMRYSAIRALAKQEDIRAAPALRRILPKVEPYERSLVVQALLAINAYTVIEQADALESVADQMTISGEDPEGVATATNVVSHYSNANAHFGVYPKPGPPDAASLRNLLGTQLLATPAISDALVRELIGRIDKYEKTDPAMAESLRRMFNNWSGPAVNALLLRDLKRGKSNTAAVLKLIEARKELKAKQTADVFDLRTGTPTALGISACLLESEADYAAILSGTSNEAKAALLACGRMVRAAIAVKTAAGHLDSSDKRLANAAELFLESEDSPEARSIVLSRHAGTARIMGATTAFWPEKSLRMYSPTLFNIIGFNSYQTGIGVNETARVPEKELRDELVNSDMAGLYFYGENSVRIYKDKVLFRWVEDESRYRERPLTKEEFEELAGYLERHRAADLPPFLDCVDYSCQYRELIMAGKQGGRRVFSATERLPKFFRGLDAIFAEFRKTPGKLRYDLEKQLPGLEILFTDDKLSAEAVWKSGADLRLLISDRAKRKAINKQLKENAQRLREDADPQTGYDRATEGKIFEMGRELEYDEYAWYELSPAGLGALMSQPAASEYIPLKDAYAVKPSFGQWTGKTMTLEVRGGADGIYLINGGRMSRLASGNYSNPVVTANGKWAIATKYREDEGPGLVRIDLKTKREFPIKSGEDEAALVAIAYVPALNKVLLTHSYYDHEGDAYRELDSESAAWLDPDTGAVSAVKGDVRPLGQQSFRSLQPTGRPNEFWAAVPSREKNSTAVGVYDSRLLSFKPLLNVPKIIFDSMDMWVEAGDGKLYFVYSGHLLSLPLPKK